MVLDSYQGSLTDGQGRIVDPAHLEPCPRCGKRWQGLIIEGINPNCY
jgi:hypothetical protein